MPLLTEKQYEILRIIIKGVEGDYVDLDQLLESLSYKTTKESMQFSIRALIKRRLIEKLPMECRRKRARVRYRITNEGRRMMNPLLADIVEEF